MQQQHWRDSGQSAIGLCFMVFSFSAAFTPAPPAAPSPPSNRRVEALGEPAVDGTKQVARLLHPALVVPKACEAHGGAEFPRFSLLLVCDRQSTVETCFRFASVQSE
jgi:hypothetical protein